MLVQLILIFIFTQNYKDKRIITDIRMLFLIIFNWLLKKN